MLTPEKAQCAACAKKRIQAICFPMPVSRVEASLGHERFKCERCGQEYKLTPSDKKITAIR